MFSPALIIVSSRIADLHAESAAQRLAAQARSESGESRGALASVVAGLRSLFGAPVESPMSLPNLNDYPYRG